MLKKFYLNSYRLMGFGFLSTISATILIFFMMMIFFLVNHSWVAPTILSNTSDKMLTFTSALTQSEQNVATLKITADEARQRMLLAQGTAAKMNNLVNKLQSSGSAIDHFTNVKNGDMVDTSKISNDLSRSNQYTQKALDVGIITAAEAAALRANTQNFHNSIADGNIGMHVATINANTGLVQAVTQQQQAALDVTTHEAEYKSATTLLTAAQKQLNDLHNTAYYNAYKSGGTANLAFLPYENADSVHVGDAVYDCYFVVAVCHKVGTISRIMNDEQLVEFPIFNVRFSRTMRGVFTTLTIDKGEEPSMHDKLMFVGGKPLFV